MTSASSSATHPPATQGRYGVSEAALLAMQQVLASHHEVETAILYGSRALGRHRPGSDIDLTLVGEQLTERSLARIEAELDDLLLPWIVDLSCLSSIRHPGLLEHIQRVGQVLYRRADPGP